MIYSLLHSANGTILYVNRSQEPAASNPKKAEDEIKQYSRMIGESPRVMKMPRRNGVPDGHIVVWGKVTLEQLDQESIKTLAGRKGLKKGLLIDFLGNFARSANAGLPIYRIAGGPGFVWAAVWTETRVGLSDWQQSIYRHSSAVRRSNSQQQPNYAVLAVRRRKCRNLS